MDPSEEEQLKGMVGSKLAEYAVLDDNLVEYVLMLVHNGRTRSQMVDDLGILLEDSTDAFVSWLWAVLRPEDSTASGT
jgi:hypothetical protein